jgi:phage repressor protein C with HTH and peptisase S24 domain
MDTLRKKIFDMLEDKNISLSSASTAIGKNVAYLHQFLNKGSPVTLPEEQRVRLANLLEVDEQELTDRPIVRSLKLFKPNTVFIEMLDVSACCGTGTDVTTEPVIGFWQMPLVDFNAMSLTKPENIKIIKAVGDSMIPTVQDGDYVFVDISNQYITSDGVYVLRLPTGLSIKRIQNGLNGDVIVRSDNPAYEPLTAKLSDVRVLGRVVRILNQRKI